MRRKNCFQPFVFGAFVVISFSIAAVADSHVRIVRLSSVEGQVQMDRGAGSGLERAILNTPIVEGTRLVTGDGGLAEVEFENESALRLAGNSEVKFSQLLLTATGAKVNQFEVTNGIVYLDTASKGDDIYRVKVGTASLLARRDTLMRFTVAPDQVKVALLKGEAQLEDTPQPLSIHGRETLTISQDASKPEIAKGVVPERFDAWNKERQDYSKTYAENAGYGGPNRAYGLQDLNYYGDFFYANGYGYVWQPYGFAGSMLNWSPYSNGAWLFDPSLGYSWASSYPWGWLPFHYGSWAFVNGAGWAWLPGGGYNGSWYASGFVTVPRITRAPAGWTAPSPPALLNGVSAPPTVPVGAINSASLTIPGGRIQPNFASLVARTAASAQGSQHAIATANGSHAVFAHRDPGPSAARQGHVFVAPARSASLVAPVIGGMGASPTASRGPTSSASGANASSHGSSSPSHK